MFLICWEAKMNKTWIILEHHPVDGLQFAPCAFKDIAEFCTYQDAHDAIEKSGRLGRFIIFGAEKLVCNTAAIVLSDYDLELSQ